MSHSNDPSSNAVPPSSSTEGFFQTPPKLQNSFDEDEALKRTFTFYLPASVQNVIRIDLSRFGSLVLQPSTLAWTADAERNTPYLKPFDTWGRRSSTLVTSEGWRKLQELGIREGIVAIAFENKTGAYSRFHQFLKYHLWTPTSALVTCPSAMQDGAARLLAVHLTRKDIDLTETEYQIFETAYKHLTSRDPNFAWTSGQWMTERSGGSDVRNTETQATYIPTFTEGSSTQDIDGLPLGPWTLNGFKWFSSATDSQMSVGLAKTPSGALSTFFIPMRRQLPLSKSSTHSSELNGITIQRLKSKLGTRAVPTAELVLSGTRAYLLGPQGQGVKNISTILNITRLHNAISAVGLWGRGLAIARAFTRVRKVSGKLLTAVPAHVHTLAQEHIEYRAMLHLSFFSVVLLGISENASQSYTTEHTPFQAQPSHSAEVAASSLGITVENASRLLRLLTPIAKAVPARAAIAGLQECMEVLGGVGYLENEDVEFNIARLYRDANVISIWEGTTNVLADDTLRVLKSPRDGPPSVDALGTWLHATIESWNTKELNVLATFLKNFWEQLRKKILHSDVDELRLNGRELIWDLSWLVVAVLLGEDARRDNNSTAGEICKRWFGKKRGEPDCLGQQSKDWTSIVEWDLKIVFGDARQELTAKL